MVEKNIEEPQIEEVPQQDLLGQEEVFELLNTVETDIGRLSQRFKEEFKRLLLEPGSESAELFRTLWRRNVHGGNADAIGSLLHLYMETGNPNFIRCPEGFNEAFPGRTFMSILSEDIEDKDVENPANQTAFKILQEQLQDVLETLPPREQEVLKMRFGLDDGYSLTLEEVGLYFNVTRERIRQIEAKALRRLRHPKRSRRLKDYIDQ